MRYKNIGWDWNGTLLDDIRISVETLNRMLAGKNFKKITEERYRDLFGFPVKGFYESLGYDFDRDDWDAVSQEFVDVYGSLSHGVELTAGIVPVLSAIRGQGIRQYILSALQENLLEEMLERFQIRNYFDGICGSDHIYAGGKTAMGEKMVSSYSIVPRETLMIGDTLHDAEVANALGFDVRLYVGGHNSERRLREVAPVLLCMEEIIKEIE